MDTSCGSGGFLLHALKEVRDEADKLYDDEIGTSSWKDYWHEFAEKHLYGIEINEQISRVAKMNMIIHDDGHTNIITNDGLKNNKIIEIENRNLFFQDGTFDLIMTNPPFGSSVKADEVGYYKEYELFEKNLGITEIKDRIADDDNKNKWRTSQNTEVLFIERCYKYLNEENGYLAIVIPDGILTNATSQYVRDSDNRTLQNLGRCIFATTYLFPCKGWREVFCIVFEETSKNIDKEIRTNSNGCKGSSSQGKRIK